MNKKGQIFTLIFVVIITILFLTVEVYSSVYYKESTSTRIETMNSFLNSLEKNLERQLYISGYRIIFLAEAEIISNGSYIDFDNFFDEAFFNGTVNGQPNEIFLTGVTYDDIVDSINEKSAKINVIIEINNSNITIAQTDPWHVEFNMTSNFLMYDSQGLANWSKVQVISAKVPIEGFEDPLYTINTNALVIKLINRTEYEGNYASGSDVTNLYDHVAKGYYAANPNAPSFLNRLEGNLSADPNGIESFVDISDLSGQGIPTKTKTLTDYIYFSNSDPTEYTVSGMQSWFLIDNSTERLVKYNVSSIAI